VQRPHLDPSPREPVDSDLDGPVQKRELAVLGVIAIGGAVGATARYLVGLAWPTAAGGFPWATLAINVVGCALIGILMVLVAEVWVNQRLLRPFLGTGILGGFTTFSTYAVDIQHLLAGGHPGTGLLYLAGTAAGALVAVWAAATTTRRLVARRQR
jgi:fluoride exporter